MTNLADFNLETPTTRQQPVAQNPALFNEGYPQSTIGAHPGATTGGDGSAKLAALSPADLAAVLSKLPPQDLSTFYNALPQADQQQLANALSGNQNATPADLASVLAKLPQQDLFTAAGSVPAGDIAQLLPAGSAADNTKTNPPGSGHSEFPLLFGLVAAGTAGMVLIGNFDRVPSMFKNLTGRFDGHMPSWMGKIGGKRATNLTADTADVVVPRAGAVVPEVATGLETASHIAPVGSEISGEVAALANAGGHIGEVTGIVGDVLPAVVDTAEVVH